jgi:sulfatase maturation enzyme AslB (radical SAM superfamily)
LDSGKPHDSYCRTCVDVEAQGGISTREYYKNFSTRGVREIKQIDIRWSNVCNLSCRMCGPDYSSDWAKRLSVPVESTNRDYYADILSTLEQHRDTIDQVDLLGGEPLMQKQNEQLLELLPDVAIHVLTNLSVPLENNRVYQKLRQRQRVKWIISLDHIGERLEYIRHNAQWSLIVANIKQLQQDFPGQSISIIPCYSIWTAWDLKEIYAWADSLNLHVNWQLIQGNDYPTLQGYGTNSYEIARHSADVKRRAIAEIDSLGREVPFLSNIRQSLIQSLDHSTACTDFIYWCFRSEKFMQPNKTFSELWPELHRQLTLEADK